MTKDNNDKIPSIDDVGQQMLDDLFRIAKEQGFVFPEPSRLQKVINYIGNRTWRKLL